MRIHVLSTSGSDTAQIVVHAAMPTGTNSAGVSWGAAYVNSGRAVTIMPIGNGPGQITQSEANQITSGALIEVTGRWDFRNADINVLAATAVQEAIDNLKADLFYFGKTVT